MLDHDMFMLKNQLITTKHSVKTYFVKAFRDKNADPMLLLKAHVPGENGECLSEAAIVFVSIDFTFLSSIFKWVPVIWLDDGTPVGPLTFPDSIFYGHRLR